MLYEFKSNSNSRHLDQNIRQYFDNFYDIIEEKAKQFCMIDEESWRGNLLTVQDSKEFVHKKVKMEYSIIYYQDIITHIMMLVDEDLLSFNDRLLERVKKILKEFLKGFEVIKLKEIKEKKSMHQLYFTD